ncbi:MAG: DUF1844 domain-containing protein [Candidatus Omnitrophota bacterium]|nr:DUF1844 domain-containing protein [Candidatus Omnitrophota bacterium]MDZ4241753.1 DUF1844 domain-containing protein [Candidatus Omnitrophota bacterium]
MTPDKNIDESWKESVSKDKEGPSLYIPPGAMDDVSSPQELGGVSPDGQEDPGEYEVNFLNYITSLALQTMIFLGEIANPVNGLTQKDLGQAKFLIDTLLLIREKTKGNLTAEEDNLLNGSIYELQMKFIEIYKKDTGGQP